MISPTKVCYYEIPPMENFHGYQIDYLNPLAYFPPTANWGLYEMLMAGVRGGMKRRALFTAEGVDRLYRERDSGYMRFLADFVNRYRDYDLIVMNHNVVHPEVLYNELRKPIKILGLHDSPQATYVRQLAYFWAFDGFFYWSPSQDATSLSEDALRRWGSRHHAWFPVTARVTKYPEPSKAFFEERDIDVVYVGKSPPSKIDRLIRLKRHFGRRFQISGRWAMGGYAGMVRFLWGKPALLQRVRPVSEAEKHRLYQRAKIAFNVHLSDPPGEIGNLRMFEAPANGALLLCDKGGQGAHKMIFEPNKEAVFYDNMDDAIERAEYFLKQDSERVAIARNGYDRVRLDYDWHARLKQFLDWAMTVPRSQDRRDHPVSV